jgi:hypothetical protein
MSMHVLWAFERFEISKSYASRCVVVLAIPPLSMRTISNTCNVWEGEKKKPAASRAVLFGFYAGRLSTCRVWHVERNEVRLRCEWCPKLTNPQARVFHEAAIPELGSAQRLARVVILTGFSSLGLAIRLR